MFAFIEGDIVQKNPESIIVNVGGIGFQLNCDSGLSQHFPAVGEKAKVWTFLNVRENEISLYGFPSQDVKSLFELLITVSGIGPKVAGSIVGNISPDVFALSVLNDDYQMLTKIKGIGKKGAQRIVLELKDKLKKSLPNFGKDTADGDVLAGLNNDQNLTGARNEVIAALMVLGYAEKEASDATTKAYLQMQEKQVEIELEDLLRNALKQLAVL